jgi:hypothetical protein
MPSDISKNAALAIYFKKNQEAESIYIQAKLYYRAIKMNIKLYKFTNIKYFLLFKMGPSIRNFIAIQNTYRYSLRV